AVGNGGAQVLGDKFDRLDGAGVGNRGGYDGDIGLDRVGQGVHAGGCSQGSGLADHQDRIVDGDIRGAAPVDDGHLHMGIGVGDDAEAGHFRGSTGSSVDGQKRRHRLGGFVDTLEVADVAAVTDHEANAFGAVVGAAAPQRHDTVALVLLVNLHAVMNVGVGRVRLGAVEDYRLQAGSFQLALDLVGNTHLGKAGIGYDQQLGSAKCLGLSPGFLGTTDAHQ